MCERVDSHRLSSNSEFEGAGSTPAPATIAGWCNGSIIKVSDDDNISVHSRGAREAKYKLLNGSIPFPRSMV